MSKAQSRSPWSVVFGSGAVVAFGATAWWSSSLGLMIRPLEQAYGWSRADIAFAFTLMTLATPLLAPLAGAVIDRVNLRRLILVSLAVQSLMVAAFSLMTPSLIFFYAMCLGLVTVAYGASVLALSKLVQGWFGGGGGGRAMGVLFACASVGAIVHPLVTQALLSVVGVQKAFLYGGLGCMAVTLAVALRWVHVNPVLSATVLRTPAPQDAQPSMLLLIRNRTWWVLAIWGACFSCGLSAIALHLPSMLQDRGASLAQSAGVLSLMGVGLMLGNLAVGLMLDKYPSPRLASVVMLGPLAAIAVLQFGGSGLGSVSGFLLGLSAGGEGTLLAYMVGRYFPVVLYGRAYATQSVAMALAGGLSPWMAGLAYGHFGGYSEVLAISALTFMAAAAVALALPRMPSVQVQNGVSE